MVAILLKIATPYQVLTKDQDKKSSATAEVRTVKKVAGGRCWHRMRRSLKITGFHSISSESFSAGNYQRQIKKKT